MHKNWERVARVMERENHRLEREIRKLRQSRDEVLAQARQVLGVAIMPDVEVERLPEASTGIEELEEQIFFPDDEHRERCARLEREVKVLEPVVETLRYWGDIRDPRDRQVRAVAVAALERLDAIRESRHAESPGSEEGSAPQPAADVSARGAHPGCRG
jgi:hypothetical protein